MRVAGGGMWKMASKYTKDNKLANQSSEIQKSTGFIVFLYITNMVTRARK